MLNSSSDYVEYWVFPLELKRTPLEALNAQILEYCTNSIPKFNEYIWSKNQGFGLSTQIDALYGKTFFTGSLEDEMYILFILFEISKAFKDTLFVKISDNDGDFLLIESADYLPRWLTIGDHGNMLDENRIYIFNGKIQVIGKEAGVIRSGDIHKTVSSCLLNGSCEADDSVQKCINNLILGFQNGLRVEDNFHYSNCVLPESVALLLKEHPQLIAPIVEAIYMRDSLSLKLAGDFKKTRPKEARFVKCRVKFTRSLFAQLMGQKVFVPPKTYPSLPDIASSVNPNSTIEESEYLIGAAEMGMKLVLGIEIILSDPLFKGTANNANVRGFESYLKKLELVGYFQGEVKGSEKYQRLLSAAKETFIRSKREEEESVRFVHPSVTISSFLDKFHSDNYKCGQSLEAIANECSQMGESSLAWTSVSKDQVEELFNEKEQHDESTDFNDLVSRLSNLLEKGKSGFEGMTQSEIDNDSEEDDSEDFDEDWDSDDESIEDGKHPEWSEDIKMLRGMIKTIQSWTPTDKGEKPALADLIAEINASNVVAQFEEAKEKYEEEDYDDDDEDDEDEDEDEQIDCIKKHLKREIFEEHDVVESLESSLKSQEGVMGGPLGTMLGESLGRFIVK